MPSSYAEAEKVAIYLEVKYNQEKGFYRVAMMYDEGLGHYVEVRIAPQFKPIVPLSQEGVVVRTVIRRSQQDISDRNVS